MSALLGFTSALRQADTEITVVASPRAEEECDSVLDQLRQQGIQTVLIQPCRGPLRSHPQLKQRLEQELQNADVVHIHGVWESIQHFSAMICRKQGIPYILRPCGMLSRYCIGQKRLKKWIYSALRLKRMIKGSDALHLTSPFEHRQLPAYARHKKDIVEPIGIDRPPISPADRSNFRKQYGVRDGQTLFTYLGRLNPIKGLDVLIEAFSQIAGDDSSRLAICGPSSDQYETQLRSLVRQFGLEDKVIFTGMLDREAVWAAMNAADVFVLPSHHENFGISALEAIACETPVILSDQVGLGSYLENQGVGVVTPVRARDLAAAMRTMICQPEERTRLADNCRQLTKKRFAWDQIALRWVRHYDNLCAVAR